MNNLQKEAIKAVETINDELLDNWEDENNIPILSVVLANDYCFVGISFGSNELNLFNSEDNDKIYNEEDDTYELMYDYIKRKFKELKDEINSINI